MKIDCFTKGFTLIEVMVVVAIIAILASIALPSYSEHIRKTRRADAKETLLRMAALQERWFFTHNSYSAQVTDVGGAAISGDTTKTLSTDGHYTITLAAPTPTAAEPTPRFSLSAVPLSTGPQKDDKCTKFTLTQTGLRGAEGDSVNNCWGK